MTRPVVLIAGGGTGGHVFPALAVAEALIAQADVEVVFCGTARGLEARVVPQAGFRLETLEVEPMKGGGAARALRGALVAAMAVRRALGLMRLVRPAVVLSVGGYAAGPASLAGALTRCPLAILEPNRVAGLANRLLAPFARRAFLTSEAAGAAFRPATRRVVGMPLRGTFRPSPYLPRDGSARVLILGGSQGSTALNERVPLALRGLGHLPGFEVVHQTGRGKDGPVRAAYARGDLGARARVVEFLEDIATAVAEADLVIGRSGASTVAEIACVGRAALFIPFPEAADDHQTANASDLVAAGAAECIPQDRATPERLAEAIGRLLGDDRARAAMAEASRAHGRPSAATDIAFDLLALAGVARRPRNGHGLVVRPLAGSTGAA